MTVEYQGELDGALSPHALLVRSRDGCGRETYYPSHLSSARARHRDGKLAAAQPEAVILHGALVETQALPQRPIRYPGSLGALVERPELLPDGLLEIGRAHVRTPVTF